MKKFMLLNQDGEAVCELEYGKFNVGILELGNVFVANIVLHSDGHAHAVGIYSDISEAAQGIQELRDFAFSVTKPNRVFAMPQAEATVSPLEIVNLLA